MFLGRGGGGGGGGGLKGNTVKKWVKMFKRYSWSKDIVQENGKKTHYDLPWGFFLTFSLFFDKLTMQDLEWESLGLLHTFTWLFGRMTQRIKVLYLFLESWKFKPNQVLGQQLR